ncbi:Hsp20/alpha crystallin family protein [Natrialbaceae archaeon AArc-T1-2]|uniref:Hsp20/alpha crystallin family protein n=1 Tax=Natrialbaceae archaeon AArc-T1-2 TaxID=3053904 RepID=UPI00255A7A7E|nr:Hsp20/alpha crystallin family protein [Natrialbaceae archaeon AArc-T1-2]WIV67677.1 Hsp20/alpha crystallin family protein [Natrialbaceae archaeon AArc-T1-2]
MTDRRPNPFQGLEELFEQMSRQFENAARSWDREEEGGLERPETGDGGSNAMDLLDRGDEFVVTIDVPGYETDDLEVRLAGETLRVSGEHRETRDEREEAYVRRERHVQSFDRRVRIPEPVDVDDVDATVDNGVLTVTLPKADPTADSHTIDIE